MPHVQGEDAKFHLHTGADVSVVPGHIFSKLQAQVGLQKTDKVLGTTIQLLHVLGVLQAPVTFKNRHVTGMFYITKNAAVPLLGLYLLKFLTILKRVNDVSPSSDLDPTKECPSLFRGLGHIAYSCEITFKSYAYPVSL